MCHVGVGAARRCVTSEVLFEHQGMQIEGSAMQWWGVRSQCITSEVCLSRRGCRLRGMQWRKGGKSGGAKGCEGMEGCAKPRKGA